MGFCSVGSSRLLLRAVGPWLAATRGCSRRTLMSPIAEVPPTVVERPITLILSEDEGLYPRSWHEPLSSTVPHSHGMQYSRFSSSGTKTASFDSALQELQADLSPFATDGVLVARGPWMSWMAQFYLESLALKGLVLVDPMLLDDQNGINQFQLLYQKMGLEHSPQYRMFREYLDQWGHWTLRLEPGSVPMMILYTTDRPAFKRCAENTALRHRTTTDNADADEIPILKQPATQASHAEDAAEAIAQWITKRAL